jgi:Fungal specific transcription factor domain
MRSNRPLNKLTKAHLKYYHLVMSRKRKKIAAAKVISMKVSMAPITLDRDYIVLTDLYFFIWPLFKVTLTVLIAENDSNGHLALDSYGQLRYIGGPANMILVKTIQDLAASSASTGCNIDILEALNSHNAQTPSATSSASNGSTLPFFSQGLVWPKLPHLPTAENLSQPPRYVSDLLVNLYFSHIHYTFPVIFQPSFMRNYQAMMTRSSVCSSARFMSVFFAVCACASSLLPHDVDKSGGFPGLEYYEKSLLLHYSCTGQGNIEQVQCLGLLALCSAGWNTLTQSWKFAGQAVRAAQDLGLHVNLHQASMESSQDALTRELARRIWWSICGLDRYVIPPPSACGNSM